MLARALATGADALLLDEPAADLDPAQGFALMRLLRREADGAALCIVPGQIARLEEEVARMNGELPPLKSFVLPGGSPASAWAHHARTIARAAERGRR
jgi:cob(I)alamin adenosyltransferase